MLRTKSSALVHGMTGCAAWRQELLELASLERPIGTLSVAWCGWDEGWDSELRKGQGNGKEGVRKGDVRWL
jgi:hypothetical protein